MKLKGVKKVACLLIVLFAGLELFLLPSCKSNNKRNIPEETTSSGTIQISVDGSFKPVIDSEIQVFESQHPDARIIVHYKPEADCLRDLNSDSIRMIIVTRGLSEAEQKTMDSRLNYTPLMDVLAYDAIAVIINNKAPDSLFAMEDIRSIAKNTSGYKYKMLLDGTKSTS